MDFLLSSNFWQGLQALLTSVAIVVGGLWFLGARRHYPRADVAHEIWSWKVDEGQKLVRVVVRVENRGEVFGGELEPGESDELSFHFVIPSEVQTVMVFSFLGNKRKVHRPMPMDWEGWRQYMTSPQLRNREFGWNKSSIHEI